MVGHLPIEVSCLITYLLQASPENKLFAVVTGKRKREVGLVVPAKYVAFSKSKTFANVLKEKLEEKKKRYSNFEFDTITAIVASVPTNIKY